MGLGEGEELWESVGVRVRVRMGVGMVGGGGQGNWRGLILLVQGQRLQRGDGSLVYGGRRLHPTLPTSVDAVASLHVLVVVRPVGKVMLTLQARVRTLTSVLPAMCLQSRHCTVLVTKQEGV